MAPPFQIRTSGPQVVVIASSVEGIGALVRLINQLPSAFPIPIVAHIHGLQSSSLDLLELLKRKTFSYLKVLRVQNGTLDAGSIYVVLPEQKAIFVDVDVINCSTSESLSDADRLFASAAHWYQSGVIGVVLSGSGTNGTKGLIAITQAGGVRIVQSPSEASFPGMPTNALVNDDVQYSVMLDEMGKILLNLATDPTSAKPDAPTVPPETTSLDLAAEAKLAKSLDRSINDILSVVREDLAMDVMCITKQSGNELIVIHSTSGPGVVRVKGLSIPKHQSLCQHILDGRLPPVMPNVEALRTTHDIANLPVAVGSYMATPVLLQNGSVYGMLCCLKSEVSNELDQRHYQRLQMSAKQIARLINKANNI